MYKTTRKLKIIDWLLSNHSDVDKGKLSSIFDWKKLFDQYSSMWDEPVDCAIMGGFIADRVAYGFAAGYRSALMRLVPSLPPESIAALCVTEEGGAHPRAIRTELRKIQGNNNERKWKLNGSKRFVTMANEADLLLVAASMGISTEGKNLIRLVLMESDSSGITVEPMKEMPFVQEISHCVILFKDVEVGESQLLPGDGYTQYIKPFRTIEDLHIFAAIFGYLFRTACQYDWPQSLKEKMLSLLVGVRTLALEDPVALEVHIVIGGIQQQMEDLLIAIMPYLERVDEETRLRWERDRELLKVAGNARARRLEKAWAYYEQ